MKSGRGGRTMIDFAETMNPHTVSGPPGNMRGMLLRTPGVFSSHGEIMKAALLSLPVGNRDVLLIDEPEAGQDLEAVLQIRKAFAAIAAKGVQVIAATHRPVFLPNACTIELGPNYAALVRGMFCCAVCGEQETAGQIRLRPGDDA